VEGLNQDPTDDYDTLLDKSDIPEPDKSFPVHHNYTVFICSYGNVDSRDIFSRLNAQSAFYTFSKFSITLELSIIRQFLANQYSSLMFIGILINTRAAQKSTTGLEQFNALQRL
jgi:hypothetical protein